MPERFQCGLVAIVGRPNVGKSTLVNRLVRHKVSITSQRPQTTRARIMGIRTQAHAQIVYIDTPGLHAGAKDVLNRHMNRAARGSLEGVDCVVCVITALGWSSDDDQVLRLVQQHKAPVILAINKVDKVKDRRQLLPLMKQAAERMEFAEIVPLSALTGENVGDLERSIVDYLPEQPALFPGDQISDRDQRFVAAELVREQVFRAIRQEVPYATAVGIEQFERTATTLHVQAAIWVQKASQKGIIIGHRGERLKLIGTDARAEMEAYFQCKVHLEIWVKVREGWSDNEAMLRSLQYGET
ncbi:MAG: GTPase Era [Acidiferrobacterales bacterium]